MADDDHPILIAYDGSDYAKAAIKQAGEQLRNGRRAIVLTVWQPYSAAGFVGNQDGVVVVCHVGSPSVDYSEVGGERCRRLGLCAGPAEGDADPDLSIGGPQEDLAVLRAAQPRPDDSGRAAT